MASGLRIIVVRGDGRLAPVPFDEDDLLAACRKALDVAQDLTVNGCPFGDAIPPRCVNIIEGDRRIFSIAVHPSLER